MDRLEEDVHQLVPGHRSDPMALILRVGDVGTDDDTAASYPDLSIWVRLEGERVLEATSQPRDAPPSVGQRMTPVGLLRGQADESRRLRLETVEGAHDTLDA